jgi:hypothetical protein
MLTGVILLALYLSSFLRAPERGWSSSPFLEVVQAVARRTSFADAESASETSLHRVLGHASGQFGQFTWYTEKVIYCGTVSPL